MIESCCESVKRKIVKEKGKELGISAREERRKTIRECDG